MQSSYGVHRQRDTQSDGSHNDDDDGSFQIRRRHTNFFFGVV